MINVHKNNNIKKFEIILARYEINYKINLIKKSIPCDNFLIWLILSEFPYVYQLIVNH